MKEPIATGFVAWHPEKGLIADNTVQLNVLNAWEDIVARKALNDSPMCVIDAIIKLQKEGWQIIEVEIFRKEKE